MVGDPKIVRTTQFFPCWTQTELAEINSGALPSGFEWWLKQNGWWSQGARAYLCAGRVKDKDAVRVDTNPDAKPTHCEDARKTSLPDESFDLVIVDPPSSPQRARAAYGDEKLFGSINDFAREAARITKPGGLIVTLSPDVPRRLYGCRFVAITGVYCMPLASRMRCCAVFQKVQPNAE